MTSRRPCRPAPGPLEADAQRFDMLFSSLASAAASVTTSKACCCPGDRHKTLTGLAGAEPISGAQHREVQRLQWFLSEAAWDHEQVNQRRVEWLCQDPGPAPHDAGALVIDDTGDRKDGTRTAHVARHYLGSVARSTTASWP
jgi:SRSO17 transposase